MEEGKELFACFSQAANALAQYHSTTQKITRKAYNDGARDAVKKLEQVLRQTKTTGNNYVSVDQILTYLETLVPESDSVENQKLRTSQQPDPKPTRTNEQPTQLEQLTCQSHSPFASSFNFQHTIPFTFSQTPSQDEEEHRSSRNRRRTMGNSYESQTSLPNNHFSTHQQQTQSNKRSFEHLMSQDFDETKRMRMSHE